MTDEKLRAPDLSPCVACDKQHGSVGAHIACLNGHIRYLRERLDVARRATTPAPREYTDEDADNADPSGFSRPSLRR